jgi:ABC-type transport system involved in cytochrome c biogenesis ATPase subunit
VKNLRKGFGDRVLIDNLSFTLPRNGIVGVIGPNGVGKTTLFKTIVGLEEPDGGEVKVGETVKISYVDQSRSGLDPKKNLWEVVSDGHDYIKVGQVEIPSRAYVSFGFKGPDQQKKAGVLSGGERNRLNLALTLKQGGNLLLLDEPTNDLDVETLARCAGERAAGVPRLRRRHQPRPVVPRPGRDAHPRLGGTTRTRPSGTGSRATSRPTRSEQGRATEAADAATRRHRS